MQLLLYKSGKGVSTKDLGVYMCSTPDLSQAITASAKAGKWLRHIPLGRGIKESHLIPFCDLLQGNYLHSKRVKEHIRVAAMVDILKVFRLQHNMLINAYLYG